LARVVGFCLTVAGCPGGWVQSHLLEQARVADPMLLARYATSLIDRLDAADA